MKNHMMAGQVPTELLPEHDVYVDDGVALARGELSGEQATAVRERMAADPVYRGVVEPIVQAYREGPLSLEDAATGWPELVRRAGLPEHLIHAALGEPAERGRTARMRTAWLAGRAAAVLALAAGLVTGADALTGRLYYETVTTDSSEVLTRTLPDGSVARLAPRSSLRFPEEMAGGSDRAQRHAWVRGDVSFEVPLESRPEYALQQSLRVLTGQARISGSAARFRVIARPRETQLEVSEGIVNVLLPAAHGAVPITGRWVWVTRGQSATISDSTMVVRERVGEGERP